MPNDWKSFINESKIKYFKLGYVHCPALDNELIYFDKHGFNHLIRKGRKYRNINDQFRRLRLLNYSKEVLETGELCSEKYGTNPNSKFPVRFWTVVRVINKKNIRVIIRSVNGRQKHFFSIIN